MYNLTKRIFFYYFNKSLPITPIREVNHHLVTFLKERANKQLYEASFKSYQNYIEQVLAQNTVVDVHKVYLLDNCTKIFLKYQINTKKLIRLHNYLAQQCLQYAKKDSIQVMVNLILMIERYNKNKALYLFKINKEKIIQKMKQFPPQVILNLLLILKNATINDHLIRQNAIEVLYKQIYLLNQKQIAIVLACLATSHKYINKQFIDGIAKRILKLYKTNNMQDYNLYGILASISQIQANLQTRSIYVDSLDQIYELIMPELFRTIHHLNDLTLNKLVSSLRRSKYYDVTFLNQIIDTSIKRQIVQLTNDEPKLPNQTLTLKTFVNVINTMAVFNYSSPIFKKYVFDILKLISLKKKTNIPSSLFSRLLWSICVLYEQHQVGQLYPLIEPYIENSTEIPIHEAMNFYYCYLYLRTSFPKISEHKEKIIKMLEGHQLQTYTSTTQKEVYTTMLDIGIPCLSEYNLNNILCDIMIPEYKSMKNIIIELHGYRHFFRNVKKLTGSNTLKQKIIQNEMYSYYFISIDQWFIAEDKKQFLKDFIDHINTVEQNKSQKIKPVAKVATTYRRSPRKFKVLQ